MFSVPKIYGDLVWQGDKFTLVGAPEMCLNQAKYANFICPNIIMIVIQALSRIAKHNVIGRLI